MDQTLNDPQYLRHVTDLAEKHEVVAHTAIFSRQGIKLVDSGHRITRALYDKLVQHKLLPSLDESLMVSDMVTPQWLMQAVEGMLAEEPAFAALLPQDAERHGVIRGFAALPLSDPLAFKLTVAREERPEILRHSLEVAWCAAALAHHSHLANHEVINAAAAGLFHDLGLLHVDPALLNNTRPLQEHERHYLYSHPLTSYLILESSPVWHPVVSTAVLEHHERIDGSGYPKGLSGSSLSPLGQLLAVAELAATLLAHTGGHASRQRLGIVLRMNEGKLDHGFSSRLLNIFPPEPPKGAPPHSLGEVLEILVDLSIVFLRWQALEKSTPAAPVIGFIAARLTHLERCLADVGIDLEYWAALDADIEFDRLALDEMAIAAREGVWQLHAIAHEIRRRWNPRQKNGAPVAAEVSEWLDSLDTLCPG